MKKETKQIILWVIFAIVVIMLVIVVSNIDAFINGFNAGGDFAE